MNSPQSCTDNKTCTKCRRHIPIDQFSRDSGKRDGRSAHCKACSAQRLAAWLEQNGERNDAARREYRQRTSAQKKVYDADRRARLAEKLREYDRKRYESEKDARTASRRKYYAKNREQILEQKRAFRAENRDAINAAARSDRSRVKAKRARRRAALKQAIPAWFDSAAVAACYRECERIIEETGIDHQVDHIVPLRSRLVCGLHWHANLQIIPTAENLKKSNLTWPQMP